MDKLLNILWIEEEAFGNQKLNRNELRTIPFCKINIVCTFKDANELIMKNNHLAYDLIILDILLPSSTVDTYKNTYGFNLITLINNLGYSKRLLILSNEVEEAVTLALDGLQYVFQNKGKLDSPRQFKFLVLDLIKNNNI
jgi:response regulator of citrate/malate metabolism